MKKVSDQKWRLEQSKTFRGFCLTYLSHHFTLNKADFHDELMTNISDSEIEAMSITAFRGSAKSTIGGLALPLWLGLTQPEKYPFIVLISDPSNSAVNSSALKYELDGNELMRADFGIQQTPEWALTNLVLKNGVRILTKSRGQKIRGLKHNASRPSLVLIDDAEGTADDVRTKEQRDKNERWLRSEVIPSIKEGGGRLIVMGNWLHNDGLMARIQNNNVIIKGKPLFKIFKYPLIENGKTVWNAMYPTQESLDIKKAKVGSVAWYREYLLIVIPEDDQIVKEVSYYKGEPPALRRLALGSDVAIAQTEKSDFTTFHVVGEGQDGNYYSLYSWQGKVSFNETLIKLDEIYQTFTKKYNLPILVGWEDVAYQRVGMQEAIRRFKIPIQGIKRTKDKTARLNAIEPRLTTGQVKFREKGDEQCVSQILNFGVEAHDDAVDSLEMAVQLLVEKIRPDIDWI